MSFYRNATLAGLLALSGLVAIVDGAWADAVDLTAFSVENYPHIDNNSDPATDAFPLPNWAASTTATTASYSNPGSNGASPSLFYSPWSVLNKRVSGFLNPGVDQDLVGFVLGFQPGSATLGNPSGGSYLLLDWKRTTQSVNSNDFATPGFTPFNNLTPTTSCALGLALSRVDGLPTADELWGHTDLAENSLGGVTQLARGATVGSTGYTVSTNYQFTIIYTATEVVVRVTGLEEFRASGSFGDGRFGLYAHRQGTATNAPIFSNFTSVDYLTGDYNGDGAIDGADFLWWQQEEAMTGGPPADGTGDGLVDGADLMIWTTSFGSGASRAGAAVPEPVLGIFHGVAALVLALRLRRGQISRPRTRPA